MFGGVRMSKEQTAFSFMLIGKFISPILNTGIFSNLRNRTFGLGLRLRLRVRRRLRLRFQNCETATANRGMI